VGDKRLDPINLEDVFRAVLNTVNLAPGDFARRCYAGLEIHRDKILDEIKMAEMFYPFSAKDVMESLEKAYSTITGNNKHSLIFQVTR
jgi:hypothetical protein